MQPPIEGVRDGRSCGDPVEPAAEADQRPSGAEDIPEAVQQPPPITLRPTADNPSGEHLAGLAVASATAPPQSPNITSGTSPASPSMPTPNEEPVSSYTCTGTATAVSWKPMNPSELPGHSRRKAACRSGSTSIAARRSRRRGVIAPSIGVRPAGSPHWGSGRPAPRTEGGGQPGPPWGVTAWSPPSGVGVASPTGGPGTGPGGCGPPEVGAGRGQVRVARGG